MSFWRILRARVFTALRGIACEVELAEPQRARVYCKQLGLGVPMVLRTLLARRPASAGAAPGGAASTAADPPNSIDQACAHSAKLARAIILDKKQLEQLLLGCDDVLCHVTGISAPVTAPHQQTVPSYVVAPGCGVVSSHNWAAANPPDDGLPDPMSHRLRARCENSISPGTSTQAELDVHVVDKEVVSVATDGTEGSQGNETPGRDDGADLTPAPAMSRHASPSGEVSRGQRADDGDQAPRRIGIKGVSGDSHHLRSGSCILI